MFTHYQICYTYMHALQKQVGSFNLRVVTMVADKMETVGLLRYGRLSA